MRSVGGVGSEVSTGDWGIEGKGTNLLSAEEVLPARGVLGDRERDLVHR